MKRAAVWRLKSTFQLVSRVAPVTLAFNAAYLYCVPY